MIRSLVAPADVVFADGASLPSAANFVPRRNLTREGLETAIAQNTLLWMDIVDPTDDEISWLEEILHLNPAIGQDLRRDDRRPALMVYPDYLFLSLFEPHITVVKSDEGKKKSKSSKSQKSLTGEDTQTRLISRIR
jgi:Mg2+ and Co2+ transporter CorA